MKILLIGNYEPDRQESMQRFAEMLRDGLKERQVDVELIRPGVRCGRFGTCSASINKWLGYLDKYMVFPGRLRKLVLARAHDSSAPVVVHICDHSNAIYTRWIPSALVTCHDLLAVRSALGEFSENPVRATGRRLQRLILDGLGRARHVACVSQATQRDLLRLSRIDPRGVSVVPNGLNYPYRPMPRAEAENLLRTVLAEGPCHGFLLHVGGNQWYKNRPGLLRIYHRLTQLMPDAPDLIIVGKPLPTSLREWIVSRGLGERVRAVGGVNNEQLRALYSTAAALLFPSLLEGFGWPIIEAQACACPVITTHLDPMSEVGGSAAQYCNPRNACDSALSVRNFLTSRDEENNARRLEGLLNVQRFSCEQMIDRYLKLYASLLSN